eukprot:167553_1
MEQHNLKVIGCGFGRTGTKTLKHTLEQLGYGPCYHGIEIFANRHHVDEWIKIAETKHKSNIDWNKRIFADVNATQIYYSSMDWPAAHYYKYLHDYYPNAKFILTVRDSEKWYNSMMNTFVPKPVKWEKGLLFTLLYRWIVFSDKFQRKFKVMEDKVYANDFGGLWNFHKNKTLIIQQFKQHIENVKQYIDKDRLFIIDWERKDQKVMFMELCKFLHVEYNGQTFVKLNDTKTMRQIMTGIMLRSFLKSISFYACIMFVLYVMWRKRKKMQS